ncbi:MAG: ribosome maturation factor RimM [Acidimicrobiales bacterium]
MTSSTSEPAASEPSTSGERLLLDVGVIAKPHGLTGEVVVELWSDRVERLQPGTVLRTRRDRSLGTDVEELKVNSARPQGKRFLIAFDGVADRTSAEALRGRVLQAVHEAVPGALWVHEMIGASVVDVDGRRLGRVDAVEANPASDLIVLDGGQLIPVRFVVSCIPKELVTVDVPVGLFD